MEKRFVERMPIPEIDGGYVRIAIGKRKYITPIGAFSAFLASSVGLVRTFHRGIAEPMPLHPKGKKGKKGKH